MMGAGKSSVGKRLARRLDLPFVDSDEEISEAAGGISTGDIFELYGEAAFRDGERRVVARLIDGPVRVIATGGGVFVNPATRTLVNARAISVWLDAPLPVLAQRTARNPNRPMLRGPNPEQVLARLLDERRSAYAEAHIHISSRDDAHAEVVEAIVTAIEGFLAR